MPGLAGPAVEAVRGWAEERRRSAALTVEREAASAALREALHLFASAPVLPRFVVVVDGRYRACPLSGAGDSLVIVDNLPTIAEAEREAGRLQGGGR